MKTVDLRDHHIAYLDDLVAVHRENWTLQTTGKMPNLTVIVSPEQRETIYGLIQAQTPYGPLLPEDGPVRWCGMTITTEPCTGLRTEPSQASPNTATPGSTSS